MSENEEDKSRPAAKSAEDFRRGKENLAALTVDIRSVKVGEKSYDISDIPALTIGAYRRLKKTGIGKNPMKALEDPENLVMLLKEVFEGATEKEIEKVTQPEAFAIVLHLMKLEQDRINWNGPGGSDVRPS